MNTRYLGALYMALAASIWGGMYVVSKIILATVQPMELVWMRSKVMLNLGQVDRRIQNWLDRVFPEYTEVFKNLEGRASLITLRKSPLLQDLVSLGASEIVSQWKNCGVMRTVGMKRAIRLVTVAEKSMGLNEGLASTKLELKALRFVRLMCKLVGELVFIHKKEVSVNGRYTLFRCEQLYK